MKKIREYETLTHTFTKRTGEETNQNKKIEGPNQTEETKQLHPTPFPMEMLILNRHFHG